ncbi:DUF397 domain-containing protein [Streptomyces europaeiscabiei]|uniref:DUF397 domain-containing protein n=1 Tax=Streptomyces europaeiscabiei TaxID=146819 RepID=A0AAJ2UR98_9ACTN|nr:DUF397 domain-containing protein [Streptomyces europaeiscabiei]MDX3136170.1 DUF397 domain-containing protein [Streptomyces europaeiscabiei]
MIGRESPERTWVRSSYSGEADDCVEVAAGQRRVMVRDSNGNSDALLVFRYAAWCGFLAGLVDPGAGGS